MRPLLLPPLEIAISRLTDAVTGACTVIKLNREATLKRFEANVASARIETQMTVTLKMTEAALAYNVSIAQISENEKAMFEKLFFDLRTAVRQVGGSELRRLDKTCKDLSKLINEQTTLDAPTKAALRTKLFASYSEVLKERRAITAS